MPTASSLTPPANMSSSTKVNMSHNDQVNNISAQLENEAKELDARESALTTRELAVKKKETELKLVVHEESVKKTLDEKPVNGEFDALKILAHAAHTKDQKPQKLTFDTNRANNAMAPAPSPLAAESKKYGGVLPPITGKQPKVESAKPAESYQPMRPFSPLLPAYPQPAESTKPTEYHQPLRPAFSPLPIYSQPPFGYHGYNYSNGENVYAPPQQQGGPCGYQTPTSYHPISCESVMYGDLGNHMGYQPSATNGLVYVPTSPAYQPSKMSGPYYQPTTALGQPGPNPYYNNPYYSAYTSQAPAHLTDYVQTAATSPYASMPAFSGGQTPAKANTGYSSYPVAFGGGESVNVNPPFGSKAKPEMSMRAGSISLTNASKGTPGTAAKKPAASSCAEKKPDNHIRNTIDAFREFANSEKLKAREAHEKKKAIDKKSFSNRGKMWGDMAKEVKGMETPSPPAGEKKLLATHSRLLPIPGPDPLANPMGGCTPRPSIDSPYKTKANESTSAVLAENANSISTTNGQAAVHILNLRSGRPTCNSMVTTPNVIFDSSNIRNVAPPTRNPLGIETRSADERAEEMLRALDELELDGDEDESEFKSENAEENAEGENVVCAEDGEYDHEVSEGEEGGVATGTSTFS